MVAHKVGILRNQSPLWPNLGFGTVISAKILDKSLCKDYISMSKKFFYLKLIFKFCASKNKCTFNGMEFEHPRNPQIFIICPLLIIL